MNLVFIFRFRIFIRLGGIRNEKLFQQHAVHY